MCPENWLSDSQPKVKILADPIKQKVLLTGLSVILILNFIIFKEIAKLITVWKKFLMFCSENTQTQEVESLDIFPGFLCL